MAFVLMLVRKLFHVKIYSTKLLTYNSCVFNCLPTLGWLVAIDNITHDVDKWLIDYPSSNIQIIGDVNAYQSGYIPTK